jgi:hypothetical protein
MDLSFFGACGMFVFRVFVGFLGGCGGVEILSSGDFVGF